MEGEERIDITLDAGTYLIGSPDSASITIADQEIFSDGFEAVAIVVTKICAIDAALKANPTRFHDTGASVFDLDTGLEWARCGVNGYFDWFGGDCSTDEIARLSNDQTIRLFNAGQLGDNAAFDDWRWATLEELRNVDSTSGACVVRQN